MDVKSIGAYSAIAFCSLLELKGQALPPRLTVHMRKRLIHKVSSMTISIAMTGSVYVHCQYVLACLLGTIASRSL